MQLNALNCSGMREAHVTKLIMREEELHCYCENIERWLDKVKDDIKQKGLSADDVYDLHGGICHRTSTSHKIVNKMKKTRENIATQS